MEENHSRSLALVAGAIDDTLLISKMIAYIKWICRNSEAMPKIMRAHGFPQSGLILSYENIRDHCISLRLEHIHRIVRPLLAKLMIHPRNMEIFNFPVDPIALNLPDYNIKIQHPMDLGTIKANLNSESFYDSSLRGIV